MDRFNNQDGQDFLKGTVNVDLVFTAGSSGAVPSPMTYSKGIASVVKSTNDYLVTFQDGYVAYLNGFGHVVQASYSSSGACSVKPSATSFTGAPATVTLSPYTAAGAAVALATGDELHFTFRLKFK